MDTRIASTQSPITHNPKRYLPPWTTPYIIGIGGYSGSGKTSVAYKIVSSLNVPWTVLVSLDNFYRPLNPQERASAFDNQFDFDEPGAIDLELATECVRNLKHGGRARVPVYSFSEHNRIKDKFIDIYGASIIIVEGIYALHSQDLLDLMDLKIFVDADLDICLARRLSRDIVSRGRELKGALDQWERFVKPNAVKHVSNTKRNADIVIPSISSNFVAAEMVIKHIKTKLQAKSRIHIAKIRRLGQQDIGTSLEEMKKLKILRSTNQTGAIKTMLLDRNLERSDFVFYFNRVAMLILTDALNDIPVQNTDTIETPNGIKLYNVTKCQFSQVAAVSIIRSGDCFMASLRKTIPHIPIGKLLIQSDALTGEPQLHFKNLPRNIEQYEKVLLMEAQIISGAALIMAIQILLDHNVKIENIAVTIYMATELGIRRVLDAFEGRVSMHVAVIATREQCDSGETRYALTRFIESKYFGSGC